MLMKPYLLIFKKGSFTMKEPHRIRHNYEDKEKTIFDTLNSNRPVWRPSHQHSVPEIDHFYHKASLVEIITGQGFLHFMTFNHRLRSKNDLFK